MSLKCRECGCNDTRVRETTRRNVTFRGKAYVYIERRVDCRYCGVTFRDVVEERDDDIELPDDMPLG